MAVTSIVTPAASRALTTPGRVRTQAASLDPDLDDAVLARLIEQASALIEGWLGRSLARERVIETLTLDGWREVPLSRFPVETVHGITVNSQALTADADWSVIDAEGGVLRLTATTTGILPLLWHDPLFSPRYRDGGRSLHAIEYTAGYLLPGSATVSGAVPLPPALELAAIELVRAMLDRGARPVGVTSETLADSSRSYAQPGATGGGLDDHVAAMLRPYKRGL